MILDDNISIKINSTTLNYYRKFGYDVNLNNTIKVKIEHLPKSSFYKINVVCDVCGKEKKLSYCSYLKNIKKYNIYSCSNKCSYFKNKLTSLEKYGNDKYNNREKCAKTCLEKYGTENVFQNEEIKNKIKKTNLEKYGFESHNRNDDVKKNKKETFLKKYGESTYLNTEEQKEKSKNLKIEKYNNQNNYNKIKETNLKKYGSDHPSKIKDFLEKRIKSYKNTISKNIIKKYDKLGMIDADFTNDIFTFNCDKYHVFKIHRSLMKNRLTNKTKLCTICNPIGINISGQEIIFKDHIKEIYKDEILLNSRKIIYPNELDIYLPKEKLAFEFNGVFWHNESHKDKYYHLNKTEICEKNNIKLVHVYEDDWLYKQNIIKSMILNNIGKSNKIHAHQCEIKEISNNKSIRNFLETNHLLGFINSKIKIGLFYNNEIVSLMTFGKLKKHEQKQNENSYKLLRHCNKLNSNVIDGASIMFNYFLNKYNPIEIIGYADRSWPNDDFYKNLNFKLIEKTNPNHYYVVDGIKKHSFKQSEKKNIFKIYDSGNLKFSWKNN